MSSPPKPDEDNVAQSTSPEDGNEGEPGPKQDETAKDDTIMDESHDIDVKEQDRWLPIANG
jgi:hypothetical protein